MLNPIISSSTVFSLAYVSVNIKPIEFSILRKLHIGKTIVFGYFTFRRKAQYGFRLYFWSLLSLRIQSPQMHQNATTSVIFLPSSFQFFICIYFIRNIPLSTAEAMSLYLCVKLKLLQKRERSIYNIFWVYLKILYQKNFLVHRVITFLFNFFFFISFFQFFSV